MKVNVLIALIVLPMIVSLGLYCYSFISTRWSRLDENLLDQINPSIIPQQQFQDNIHGQFQVQKVRHAFRSRYSLFGYCLDYKWLDLLTIKSSIITGGGNDEHQNRHRTSTLFCRRCNQSHLFCPETECCWKRCDNVPDCPTYIDEEGCVRSYNQTRYYWKEAHCMWQSTWIGNQPLPRYSSSLYSSPRRFHSYTKNLRYIVMFLLFVAAPILIFLAFLSVFCANCVERFVSIPFAFVSFLSFGSFLSGCGGLSLFLYEWIQERLHRPYYTYEHDHQEALLVALNPWLIDVEQLGLAFWIVVGAVGATLFTTLLSCCLCCGLQSEKSKLRIHIENDTYTIIQPGLYDQ